jgi:hypothetical protein
MAQDQQFITLSGDWLQVTNADVTVISFEAIGGSVEVRYAAGEVTPAVEDRGFTYLSGQGEQLKSMTDLVALSGANRVYMRTSNLNTGVVVDHA